MQTSSLLTANPMLTQEEEAVRPRLVLCEHGGAQRSILKRMIADSGFDVTATASGLQTLRMAEAGEVDVVIANVELEDISGHELCWQIKSIPEGANTYVIIASSGQSSEHHAASLDVGADDMMRKPFEQNVLRARLRVARRTLALVRRLRAFATTDVLTGVMNRRAFDEQILAEVSRAARHDLSLSLILCDADHFKAINDEHGHGVGDQCLRRLAEVLGREVRSEDQVARIGGEEFAILAPMQGLRQAGRLSERIRSSLANAALSYSGGEVRLTASFGAACLSQIENRAHSSHESLVEALMVSADNATYRAKRGGRNRVCLAGDEDLRAASSPDRAA